MQKPSGDFLMCMPLIGCLGSQLWDPYFLCPKRIPVPPNDPKNTSDPACRFTPVSLPKRLTKLRNGRVHIQYDHIWIRGQESYLLGNHRFWEASDFGLTSHLEMLLKKDQMWEWEFSLHWWQWCVLFFQAVIELNT